MLRLMASCCAAFCALASADDTRPRPRTFLDFRPSQHGFLFINSFDGSPIGDIGVPGASTIAKRVVGGRFGLCGGMSFAAADLFRAGIARPPGSTVPPDGTPWYQYIHARQAESQGADLGITLKFAEWIKAPDDGLMGVRTQTLVELIGLRAKLDGGEGAVLGLVFPAEKRNRPRKMWEHHQVLGYRIEPGNTAACAWRLFIYDPNYPQRDDAVIEYTPVFAGWMRLPCAGGGATTLVPRIGASTRRSVPGRDASPLRGVFDIPYTPRVPPASLLEGADARW